MQLLVPGNSIFHQYIRSKYLTNHQNTQRRRTVKKLYSLILAAILILSIAAPCYASNTDTLADWNVKITVPDGKTAVLQGSEYYIFGQHEGSIPYVMLRPYRYDDPEEFILDFTEYMQGQYTDLTVTFPATRKTIGNKRCWEIDYGYTVKGYDVHDRRVIITVDGLTYMFASKEIESNGMTIGSMLDDVVADCVFLGPGADSILVDSEFMMLTGLSEMSKALDNGATIESVYYTDGYGFSTSEFTTTDPEEIAALWNAITRIRLVGPTNMSITDWYPLIAFTLSDGSRYGARFEGTWLTLLRDNYEIANDEEFWSLTKALVQKHSQEAEPNYLSGYAPVLDTYLSFLDGSEPEEMDTTERGDYYFVLGETGISELSRSGGELGFCLRDLDRNGIPELLIGATGADYYDETLIYDMFTLENGVPVRVLVSSARVRYYLAEEDLILHEGSGGASWNQSVLFSLDGSKLELAHGIVMADDNCYEVFEDRESLFTERLNSDRAITKDEFYKLLDELENLRIPMDLKGL